MASSLSNLDNNLPEGRHRIKYKLRRDNKKSQACGIKHKYCDCFHKYANFKDDLIIKQMFGLQQELPKKV